MGSFRRIYLNSTVTALKIDKVFETIVHSLITLAAFITVAAMIFVLRSRIFGTGVF